MHNQRFAILRFLTWTCLLLVTACQGQPSPSSTAPSTTSSTSSASGASAGASAVTASLSELQGQVGIKQPGATDFSPASSGLNLQVGGQIQTGDDGHVRLDLSTGTILRISPSSLFTLVSNQPVSGGLATQLELTLGRLFIILKGGTADVTTPSGVASVRGSYLGIEVDPNTGDVYAMCIEGHCGASNDAGSVDFSGGQKTLLFHKDPKTGLYTVPNVGTMTPEDFQIWLNENPEIQDIVNLALTAMAPTPVGTEPPSTGGGGSCVTITNPPNGTSLPQTGRENFSWDPKDGASKYILTINYPNGAMAIFETSDTNITRYMESMPPGGSYSWNIAALDANGHTICTTDPQTFTKLETEKPPKKDVPGPQCSPADGMNESSPCFCGLQKNFNAPWCPAY